MKKPNAVRNLLMIALLDAGIFAVGAETQTLAQDGSGYIIAGNRSGYISASGGTGSAAAPTSTSDSTRSGYLISTGRAENTNNTTQQNNEAESVTPLETILEFFFLIR